MKIHYYDKIGQYGNKLFPTIIAKLISYKLNFKIDEPSNKLVVFKPSNQINNDDELNTVKITGKHFFAIMENEWNPKINLILIRGYYQKEKYFLPYRDLIKNQILDLPTFTKNTKDIVLHIRLDGFNHEGYNSHILPPEYYLDILNTETFENLYIVMATTTGKIRKHQKNKDRYISLFDKWNPKIVSNDEYTDFNFLRSFNKIISSNSTFSWWSAFLSEAELIYLPKYFEGSQNELNKIGNISKTIDHNCFFDIETFKHVNITYN
tara:strand:+ start:411 stop:1205 length:795 start_codon:yes stop_codon:yes gene_type:complete